MDSLASYVSEHAGVRQGRPRSTPRRPCGESLSCESLRYNPGEAIDMDLGALANQLVDGAASDAARSWLADLASLAQGVPVIQHIQGEADLPTTPEGLDAVRRF